VVNISWSHFILLSIWGCHDGNSEKYYVLGCDDRNSRRNVYMFRRHLMLPSSVSKNKWSTRTRAASSLFVSCIFSCMLWAPIFNSTNGLILIQCASPPVKEYYMVTNLTVVLRPWRTGITLSHTHTQVYSWLEARKLGTSKCVRLHSSKPITSYCTSDSNSMRDPDNFQPWNSCIKVGMVNTRKRDFK
jgi:hypothetical protein